MTIKADPKQFHIVSEEVERFFGDNKCPMKPLTSLMIAVDEILNNIASYAYPDGEGDVTVEYGVNGDIAYLRFIDSGLPYNPLIKADPDITLDVEERGIGGLGILMIKKMMDSVEYEYVNGTNQLTIQKKMR